MHFLHVLHPACQVEKLPAPLTGSLSFIIFQRKLIIDFVKAHRWVLFCFKLNLSVSS